MSPTSYQAAPPRNKDWKYTRGSVRVSTLREALSGAQLEPLGPPGYIDRLGT